MPLARIEIDKRLTRPEAIKAEGLLAIIEETNPILLRLKESLILGKDDGFLQGKSDLTTLRLSRAAFDLTSEVSPEHVAHHELAGHTLEFIAFRSELLDDETKATVQGLYAKLAKRFWDIPEYANEEQIFRFTIANTDSAMVMTPDSLHKPFPSDYARISPSETIADLMGEFASNRIAFVRKYDYQTATIITEYLGQFRNYLNSKIGGQKQNSSEQKQSKIKEFKPEVHNIIPILGRERTVMEAANSLLTKKNDPGGKTIYTEQECVEEFGENIFKLAKRYGYVVPKGSGFIVLNQEELYKSLLMKAVEK
jgi:hypothetical protein